MGAGGGGADQALHAHDGVAAIRPRARVGDVEVVPISLGGELRIANLDVISERGVGSLHAEDQTVSHQPSELYLAVSK